MVEGQETESGIKEAWVGLSLRYAGTTKITEVTEGGHTEGQERTLGARTQDVA